MAKSIASLVNDAASLLQRLVRIKAADENGMCICVTCGKADHWKDMDGGHFIKRTYTAHKLLEENIHPQCRRCNRFMDGEGPAYTLYMIDIYGRDFVDELEQTKRTPRKYRRVEILEIIEELKQRVKEAEQCAGQS